MVGVKLFILLYLVYMVNAQYRRTPLRQLPDRPKPEESPYSDITEATTNPTSLDFPARTRSIPSELDPETNTVSINKRPIVNPDKPTSRYLNRTLFRPRQMPSRRARWYFKPRIGRTEKYDTPESELDSKIKSISELEIIKAPKSTESGTDDESELDLDFEIDGPDSELELQPRLNELDSQSDLDPIGSEQEDNSQSEPELEIEAKLEPDQEPKTEIELEPKIEPEVEVELEPKIESQPEPESEVEPNSEPKIETEGELDPESEPKLEPEAELESKLGPDSNPIPVPAKPKTPEKKPYEEIMHPRSHFPDIVSRATEFQCEENNAFYAIVDSCDTFVECQELVPNVRTCPDGLLFNRKAKWPRYPCSYPSEVECGNNTHIDTPMITPSGGCPRRFGTFPSSNNDCEKYIVCEDGRATIMSCPMGLGFNSKIGACDWPANIPNCNPIVFKDFTCPVPARSDKSDKVYNYRYKNSCKLYITCFRGESRLLRCDSGLSFDDKSARCISSAAVSNCKNVSEIVDTKLLISKA